MGFPLLRPGCGSERTLCRACECRHHCGLKGHCGHCGRAPREPCQCHPEPGRAGRAVRERTVRRREMTLAGQFLLLQVLIVLTVLVAVSAISLAQTARAFERSEVRPAL